MSRSPSADRVARFFRAHDGFQLWSERFDRDLDDIFAIQDEIARSIVDKLELTLGLKHAETLVARPTEDLEAFLAWIDRVDPSQAKY